MRLGKQLTTLTWLDVQRIKDISKKRIKNEVRKIEIAGLSIISEKVYAYKHNREKPLSAGRTAKFLNGH